MTQHSNGGGRETPVSRKAKDVDMVVKFEYETETINLWISGTTH